MAAKNYEKTNKLKLLYNRLCDDDKRIFIAVCQSMWGLKKRQVHNIINGTTPITAKQLMTVCDLLQCKPKDVVEYTPTKPLSYHAKENTQTATIVERKLSKIVAYE